MNKPEPKKARPGEPRRALLPEIRQPTARRGVRVMALCGEKKCLRRLSAVRAAAIVAVISALMFLPVYALLPGKMLLKAAWQEFLVQGVFQGILIGAVSIFVYTRAVTLLGASQVSLFTETVPVITVIAAFGLLAEVPSLSGLIGVRLSRPEW